MDYLARNETASKSYGPDKDGVDIGWPLEPEEESDSCVVTTLSLPPYFKPFSPN